MSLTLSRAGDDVHILLDRQSALDIAAFTVAGVDLSPGIAIPSGPDRRIDHALAGFLFTCGPEHVRHPETIGNAPDGTAYPLHGSLCGTPVRDSAMTGVDGSAACRGEIEVALADGGRALIERQWSIGPATAEIMLADRVTNIGTTPFASMMLYHINIGGRLCGPLTRLSGQMLEEGGSIWRFGAGERSLLCEPAHGAAVDGWASLVLGPLVAPAGLSLHVRFRVDTLPYLQIWRCQEGMADVISLEPVSHRLAKRTDLAAAGELPDLLPGEATDYAIAFRMA